MSDPKLKGLQKGFEIKERLLMTAGMTNISGRVKSAMISPLITVNDPQYEQLLKDIIEGIRYIFQTTNKYTFAITGPTSLAFETAICNVLNPNDKILVVIHGVEAERFVTDDRTVVLNDITVRLN